MKNIKLLKIIYKYLLRVIFLPVSLLLLSTIIIVKPFKIIRICRVPSTRFGHFIGNSEIYLTYRNSFKKKKDLILFFLSEPIANNFVKILVKRKLTVFPSFVLLNIHSILKRLKKFNFFKSYILNIREYDRDLDNVLIKNKVNLTLNSQEEKRGLDFLKNIGLNENDKFVCLINRESNYLKNRKVNHEIHEFRNSEINNYKLACEEILKKGFYIFRMGRNVKPFNLSDKKFIDYANYKYQSDFLDIFLASKCQFAFGDGDGWIMAPIAFRKPMALANWVPAGIPYLHNDNLFYLFKHYYDKKTGKNLTLKEIFSYKLAFLRNFNKSNNQFELKENSPEEIRDLVLELILKLEKKWQHYTNDSLLKNNFSNIMNINSKNKIWSLKKDHKLHNRILGNYSMNFLRKNSSWIK